MVRSARRRTDAELLAAAPRDGDAFAELYRRNERTVAAYVAVHVRDSDAVADLTAETFATALVSAGRFRDEGLPAAAWLVGIARNLVRAYWRRGAVHQRATRRLGMFREPLSPETSGRLDLLIDDPRSPLLVALRELPEAQRQAICAHILDDKTYSEIAAEVGVSETVVRKRVSRGLAALRLGAARDH